MSFCMWLSFILPSFLQVPEKGNWERGMNNSCCILIFCILFSVIFTPILLLARGVAHLIILYFLY
jgi:hypothetical protein